MVLELSNVCLRSIRDGIEQGRIVGAHLGLFLPPYDPNHPKKSLRQRVLDWVFMNGSINNPNCLATLSSMEFLDGMSSLSTSKLREDDSEYLTRVASVLASATENGETIGSKITKLELVKLEGIQRQIQCVARIIAECSNLQSLLLSSVVIKHKSGDYFSDLLKTPEFESTQRVMENLFELSINGDDHGGTLLNQDFLGIPFKNLCSIYLRHVTLDGEAWSLFMHTVKDTLISLHVDGYCTLNTRDNFLPCPMPALQDLKLGFFFREYNFRVPAYILKQCNGLNHLLIPFTSDSDEELMVAVNKLSTVAVDVELFLCSRSNNSNSRDQLLLPEEPPRFRLVDSFKEKITYVHLVFVSWKEEYAVAFENFVEVCIHLTEFSAYTPSCGPVDMTALFNNVVRARQLRRVRLDGNILFGNLFQNCRDLDSLGLLNTKNVDSNDLIQWAQRGGRLSKLEIVYCGKVDHDGVVALLIVSGSKLRQLLVRSDGIHYGSLWGCLDKYCPFVEMVKFSSRIYMTMPRSMSFKGLNSTEM